MSNLVSRAVQARGPEPRDVAPGAVGTSVAQGTSSGVLVPTYS